MSQCQTHKLEASSGVAALMLLALKKRKRRRKKKKELLGVRVLSRKSKLIRRGLKKYKQQMKRDSVGAKMYSPRPTFVPQAIPKSPKRPFAMGLVNGVECRMLFDTGSEVLVVSPALVAAFHGSSNKQVALQVGDDFSSQVKSGLVDVKGVKIIVSDVIRVHIRINGVTYRENAYVADITEDCIVGCPQIDNFNLYDYMKSLTAQAYSASGVSVSAIQQELIRMDSDFQQPLTLTDMEDLDDTEYERTYKITESPELKRKIEDILAKHKRVFNSKVAKNGAQVPAMPIDLNGPAPRPYRPRPVSPAIEAAMKEIVADLLDQGVISESTSSFSSPVVMVRKPTGAWRFCVDYRSLNAVTVKFMNPMPNNMETLERMRGKRYFCVIDLRNGFYNFPIKEEDRHKTAFACPFGLFEFNRLSMGLSNSPPWFQKVITNVLHGLIGNICECFVDDICIYADTESQLVERLDIVLSRLSLTDVRVKLDKCQFGLTSVVYLGHLLNGDGITISSERKLALSQFQIPQTVKALRRFLGFTNYMRMFIPNYARQSAPLNKLLNKNSVWPTCMGAVEIASFEKLKQAIIDAPMLAFLDYEKPIFVATDASVSGVGGVLYQLDDAQNPQIVCFVSKGLNDVQSKWSTIEIECFAIFFVLNKIQQYVRGHNFVLLTDHKNLKWLYNSQVPKLVRWSLFLQEFTFDIQYIPGPDNVVSDALSRMLEDFKHLPVDHDAFHKKIHAIGVANQYDDEVITSTEGLQLLADVHNDIGGHIGITASLRLLRDRGYEWSGMAVDVYDYIQRCITCQKVKGNKQTSLVGDFRSLTTYDPFYEISLDTLGPYPIDSEGNQYIMSVVDSFTRYTELVAVKDKSSASAAHVLLQIFKRYGSPVRIRSDGGGEFVNEMIAKYLELLKVEHVKTLPYRPQANALVERRNKDVNDHLRAICFDRHDYNWSKYLPCVQRILNSAYHSSLGVSPNELIYGGRINLNRNLVGLDHGEIPVNASLLGKGDYFEMMYKQEESYMRNSLLHLQSVVENRRTRAVKGDVLNVGDLVKVSHPLTPFQRNDDAVGKLQVRWMGPRKIMERHHNTYKLMDYVSGKADWFDISRIERFFTREALSIQQIIAIAARDRDEWPIENIIDYRRSSGGSNKKGYQFRVRWRGFDSEEDTWEDYMRVRDTEAFTQFVAHHPKLKTL